MSPGHMVSSQPACAALSEAWVQAAETNVSPSKHTLSFLLRQAREFWDNHLQGRLIVPWQEFITAFGEVHTFMNPNEPPALKRTVDLLENNYVSRFEFDVFTR